MDNIENDSFEKSKKINRRVAFVLTFLVIALSIYGIKTYLNNQEQKKKIAETEKELKSTIAKLTDIRTELDQKMIKIKELGGDISVLQQAKEDITKELQQVKKRTNINIQRLRSKVDGYKQLLKLQEQEIKKLKSLNKELYTENKSLKTEQSQLNDSLVQLETDKKELASKVALASQLKAVNVSVSGINSRGKERTKPGFKVRRFKKLKLTFAIAKNKIAPKEKKTIYIRVADKVNRPLFDIAQGGGTFMIDGKEQFYTLSQDLLFDNSNQAVEFIYDKGSPYEPGVYKVDIFTEGYSMGSTSFEIKK